MELTFFVLCSKKIWVSGNLTETFQMSPEEQVSSRPDCPPRGPARPLSSCVWQCCLGVWGDEACLEGAHQLSVCPRS